MSKLKDMSPDDIKDAEPEILSQLLDDWQHLKKTGAVLEDRAKHVIGEGTEIPGWYLKDGAKMKGMTDIREAVALMLKDKELKISSEELLDICSLPMGKLVALIAYKLNLSKSGADIQLQATLGDVLTYTQKSPSLKRSA